MNVLGIGTEITECPRIGKMIEQHGELFLRRVFTDREIRCCQAKKRALEHFAARWAAKEAIFKAIGTGPSTGISWTDIEIRNQNGGRMTAHLRGGARDWTDRRGIQEVLITISHCRTYATAYALALGGPFMPVARGGEHERAADD
jgi:holo-[acyl-carrier protein] synthase